MKFITTSNLSNSVHITQYVKNIMTYSSYAIQPEQRSGSDVILSLMDEDDEHEEYGQDLNYVGLDYDLDYTENTKNYQISEFSNHKQINTFIKNRKHIYVSVELPHRAGNKAGKRSELFRLNEYGDLVIIV